MYKILLILCLLCFSCSNVTIKPINAFEAAKSIATEIDNIKKAGDMEELQAQIISEQIPLFVSEWNLCHSEDEWLPIPTEENYAIWIITKAAMDRLYIEINGGYVPINITNMVSFCWHSNQIIIMSRNDKGDLYHEIGHSQFPTGNEFVVEAFRKWCESHK